MQIILVGCGAMGELAARLVYARPHAPARVVATADTRDERAAAVGAMLGVPAYRSLAAALAATTADAADIRLPHDGHAAAVREALAAGLHVLVEKPLATTAVDGQAMLAAAHNAGRVIAVAENYPHVRAVQAAVTAIDNGRIGELVAFRSTRAYQLGGVWVRDGWRVGGGAAAGILLDQGTHHTSLLRRLGGEVVAVSAAPGRSVTDTVGLTLRFASGVLAQSLYTWSTPPTVVQTEAVAYGTTGRIEIGIAYDTAAGSAVLITPDAEPETLVAGEYYYDSHRAIVADFAAAVRAGRPPLVDGADALADLEVVLAAARSMTEGGREVAISGRGSSA
jgi:UDP-N-acetyl-2-amino-2-deoxyglucuronate dehydrogenase